MDALSETLRTKVTAAVPGSSIERVTTAKILLLERA